MQEHQINVAVRLAALEDVVVHLGAIAMSAAGATPEALAQWREKADATLGASGLPGFDPAMSDHLSDSHRAAVIELIDRIRSSLEKTRPAG